LFCGNDRLIADAERWGCDGIVSGVACAVPELIVALHAAVRVNDAARLEELQRLLLDFIAWVDRFPVPVGIAAATEARGAKVGPPAVPLTAVQAVALEHFREWLAQWLPLIQRLTHARPTS
jgi:4-hydroxy-tetrahydrodipicolinate synthase